jgi:hypothetical protein
VTYVLDEQGLIRDVFFFQLGARRHVEEALKVLPIHPRTIRGIIGRGKRKANWVDGHRVLKTRYLNMVPRLR